MARPRKSKNVLEASGAFVKNPKRGKDREHEPTCNAPLGSAPDYFNVEQIKVWKEIEDICPYGVLFNADRLGVEALTMLIYDFRAAPQKFTAAMYAQMKSYIGLLGLSPIDRAKLKVQSSEEKETNEFGL